MSVSRPLVESLEDRSLMSKGLLHIAAVHGHSAHGRSAHGHPPIALIYRQTNLVSDIQGMAPITDPNLKNPWGIASGSTTPFWVSDNQTGVSTLYNASGTPQPLVVTIPPPMTGTAPSAPTGIVFNDNTQATAFLVNGPGTRALFIFATEDGTIAAWNAGTSAVVKVDNSGSGAVYKGLALANTAVGTAVASRLYATNFSKGTVDVFDQNFSPVSLSPGAFTDSRIPAGYAPFGIANIGGNLVVTYALQDDEKVDDAPGRGHGFVDVYDPNGALLRRVATRGALNSPWGVALAPAGFGRFSNDLLIGDFGDGRINAYRPVPGGYHFDGQLLASSRKPITIDGLWGLKFGTNVGNPNTLYFTAGINHEENGLFGTLTPASN
ncbi:TIGR03118 family protein [Singulisphaera sp. Ch08]|uniref:TIGR03118 family protein n=1 Tax=Singulisphaera sp. Ch08 TaxID=3120278 RepID=A0AAU7CM81_9BACT